MTATLIKQKVWAKKKSIHAVSEAVQKEKLKDLPVAAQQNIAYRKFEKEIAKIIKEAILNGIEISQIKQVVKALLQSKEASPCA